MTHIYIHELGLHWWRQLILDWLVVQGNIHYNDVIMGPMAFQITSLTIIYSAVYSGTDQRKHQSSASLAFVRRIHRSPVNSPHKGSVMQKILQFDDVIMCMNNCQVDHQDSTVVKFWVSLHIRDFKYGFCKPENIPDSKVHGANMGPTWVLSAPDWPHVGLMNLAIRDDSKWLTRSHKILRYIKC